MLIQKLIRLCLICVFLFSSARAIFAEQNDTDEFYKTSAELQRVLLENFDAYEKEEIFRVLSTIHTLSPTYLPTKDVANAIFPDYELKYEVVGFKLLAIDDEYAIARVLQKTFKVEGPKFKDNVIDAFIVYKQEKAQWKLWSQIILGVEYIN